jgi:DNA end-binding protein Ku
MATVFKGSISFGLVVIPVKVSPAARSEKISFNQLHTCGSRINLVTKCPQCSMEVERKDLQKGYEYAKGSYIIVTDAELEACESESSRTLEIEHCVSADEVDPMLFDSSYYLEPEPAGVKGYKLLLEALKSKRQYAIARMTMSSREHVIIIRPFRGALAFHTMYFEAEVRAVPSMGLDAAQLKPGELALAQQLLSVYTSPFEHGSFSDGYQTAVAALLEAKQQGETVHTPPKEKPKSATVDLMSMLEASLKAGGAPKKPPTKTEPKPQPKRKSA